MPTHKIGPWSNEDWAEFVALPVDPPPAEPARNTLAEMYASGLGFRAGALEQLREQQRRDEWIASAWAAREAHPVYKVIAVDPSFRAGWRVFERRRKAAGKGSKLAADNAALIFLRELVEQAGHAYQLRGAPDISRGGDAKRRRTAARHADALSALLTSGVRMKDYLDTERLRTLLKSLSDEMQNTRRKAYGGKRYTSRWLLKMFALMLVLHLDFRSPAILCHFARMVGLDCETKTAQRYFDEVEEDIRRKRLAASLRAGQSDTASTGQNSS